MSAMIVVAQALAVVLKGNETPTNLKKEPCYHRLIKTDVNFYKCGIKSMHGITLCTPWKKVLSCIRVALCIGTQLVCGSRNLFNCVRNRLHDACVVVVKHAYIA